MASATEKKRGRDFTAFAWKASACPARISHSPRLGLRRGECHALAASSPTTWMRGSPETHQLWTSLSPTWHTRAPAIKHYTGISLSFHFLNNDAHIMPGALPLPGVPLGIIWGPCEGFPRPGRDQTHVPMATFPQTG